MRAFKAILLALVVALVLVDFSWHVWDWHHYAKNRAALERFKVEDLSTDDWSGIGIFDAKSGQPIWTAFDFTHDGKPNIESYYFQGREVFDVALSSNRPPKYCVFFRGAGKSETWWIDRLGNGSFTERIFYDTNGVPFKHEVWYDDAWRSVDKRDGTNGFVINGVWHSFVWTGTNKTWTVDGLSTNYY